MPTCRCADVRACALDTTLCNQRARCRAYCGLSVQVILFYTPVRMARSTSGLHHYLILILGVIPVHFQMNTHHLSRGIWRFPINKTVWLKGTQRGDEPVGSSAWCFHPQTWWTKPIIFFCCGGGAAHKRLESPQLLDIHI